MRKLYLTWDARAWGRHRPGGGWDQARSAEQHGRPLTRAHVLTIRRNHEKAVRADSGSDIAGPLPRDKFGLRVFVLARKNSRKEALQSKLDADFRFQTSMQECKRARRHSSQGFDHRARKQFERNHG